MHAFKSYVAGTIGEDEATAQIYSKSTRPRHNFVLTQELQASKQQAYRIPSFASISGSFIDNEDHVVPFFIGRRRDHHPKRLCPSQSGKNVC